ncbi:alpha/beta hydrolase [Mycobacterium sp. WMMD1722]|uniref:alpha/beta hydrolase n=1 Tax=Mycobacterium sp. WMMD1722 TaxID=3404117 RepID=UPI003BF576C1
MAVLIATFTACARQELEYYRLTLDGENAVGVSRKGAEPRGIVLFFHGMDRDETILDVDEPHRELTEALTGAGYVVVASRAGGNVWGNAASRRVYADLAYGSAEHYGVDKLFLLSESMGAIAATNLMAGGEFNISGMVAINPLLDVRSLEPKYVAQAEDANSDVPISAVNPIDIPVAKMKDEKLRFYVTPDDQLVPTDRNATAFERRYGGVADISTVMCSGEHMDPSCIQGKDIVAWFNSLG